VHHCLRACCVHVFKGTKADGKAESGTFRGVPLKEQLMELLLELKEREMASGDAADQMDGMMLIESE